MQRCVPHGRVGGAAQLRIQYRSLCATLSEKFVPTSPHILTKADVHSLEEFIRNSRKLFILTGAGLSTESGIPDYRSTGVGMYATSKQRPIQYSEFVKNTEARRRYWARNYAGWPSFSSRQPNLGHMFLSELERRDMLHWLVTQNVDRLHRKAGSSRVSELHGSTHDIICLQCKAMTYRSDLQIRMAEMNPQFHDRREDENTVRPDGDVHFETDAWKSFHIPDCQLCGGMLKPNVVFFGDVVPRPLVTDIYEKLGECDAMLVIGSSLEVYSSYRFALAAAEQSIPMCLLNIGSTRADHLASMHIHARCGETMKQLSQVLFGDVYWLSNV
ncbi:NAD-dependent protein lipoamidase sirtuin-4, mitochondrial-like [Sycon ciliatum]|uniref:NAD-dependent protein lipoamidase sirtuin-4, mitochondrial-like n=1 Tax=Sycon ciliatum TaxID=27933 RepID=UPI0020A9EDFE